MGTGKVETKPEVYVAVIMCTNKDGIFERVSRGKYRVRGLAKKQTASKRKHPVWRKVITQIVGNQAMTVKQVSAALQAHGWVQNIKAEKAVQNILFRNKDLFEVVAWGVYRVRPATEPASPSGIST